MGSKSDEFETLILGHIFKGTAWNQRTHLYVALSTSTLSDTCHGTGLNGEVSGGAYARKQCDTWTVSNGTASNNIAITFNQATASWGTLVTFAVCDHSSTGDVLYYGTLSVSKSIGTSDQAKFATGDLDVTEG